MDYIDRVHWVRASQAFFDAYVKFRLDGTNTHSFELNSRNIEIIFIDHNDYLTIKLYCPDIRKQLSGIFDQLPKNTEETIRKIHWLAWEAQEQDIYELADAEDEYQQLSEMLVRHYRLCYDPCGGDDWKGVGEEEFDIKLHNRQIKVHFYPDAMWDENEYIAVDLFCYETGRNYSTIVQQKEDDPKEIIRLIQDLASEPEIIEFNVSDYEWEHELLKNALIGRRTEDGLPIKRYPFCWVYNWEEADIAEQYIKLHDRQIRMHFEPHGDTLQIILDCIETGKSFTWGFPKQCRNVEEVSDELISRIQKMAWEDI